MSNSQPEVDLRVKQYHEIKSGILCYDRLSNATVMGYVIVLLLFILNLSSMFLSGANYYNVIGISCVMLTLGTGYLGETTALNIYYKSGDPVKALKASMYFYMPHIFLVVASFTMWILSIIKGAI